jgi:hypothetical protein
MRANTFNPGNYPAATAYDGEYLTRKQLADAAGIKFNKMRDLVNFNKDIQWPKNYGSIRLFQYAAAEVEAFLSANDLRDIDVNYPHKQKARTPKETSFPTEEPGSLDMALAQSFIRGNFAPKAVRHAYLDRRMKAAAARPVTQRVRVQGEWPLVCYSRDI